MRKQIIKLTVAFLFVITLIGTSSATTSVNTTDTQYLVGQQVAQQALTDTQLNLQNSDKNLLITTAGSAQLNGQTTQDSVQAVVDSTKYLSHGQNITYGSGNLLTINDPNGQMEFTFVSLTGTNNLMAKKYSVSQTGAITNSSTVYIGTLQSEAQFQAAIAALGSNGFDLANIANLWAAGAPADLMALTFTNGEINQGSIANYAETKTFALKYTNTTTGAFKGSNYIITTAGGGDDDSPIYGSFGFNDEVFSTSNGPLGQTAFINYNTNTTTGARTGVLALMAGNDLTNQFGAWTAGTLSEINFNLWLLNKLKTSPQELFNVLAFKTVNEADIKYLWYDNTTSAGAGIDTSYINGLNNVPGGWAGIASIIPILNYGTMFSVGQDAFNYAYYTQHLFSAEDLANGRVAVSLAPYYVNYLGSRSLVGLIDGIVSAGNNALVAAGYTNAEGFTIDNILSIRNPWMWSSNIPVIFINVTQGSIDAYAAGQSMSYLTMQGVKSTYTYNSTSSAYQAVRTGIVGLSPQLIAQATQTSTPSISPIANGFLIPAPAGLMYAWSAGASYSYLRTIARVGCICSTKEYDLAMILQGQYPLGPTEHYIVTALTALGETNRQISGRTTAWGVSMGQGTYYSLGQTSNAGYQLLVTIWDDATNTGRTMLIAYADTTITQAMRNGGYTAYAQENDLFWHLDRVWNNGPDAWAVSAAITTARTITNIDANTLSYFNAAGGDPITRVLGYVAPVTPLTPLTLGSSSNAQDSSGTGLVTIVTNALNGLGTSSAANNEIAPGLPLEQSTAATGTTSTGNNAGLPIGTILGAIFLVIAGILVYLGRNTIVATLRGYGRPGK